MARQKEFDTQDVLEKAMYVFWQKGYENTSVQDLVDNMGIHRRSIYDTFGDKHNLFILSLQLYKEKIEKLVRKNTSKNMSAYEQLKVIFSVSIIDKDNSAGCLIVNSATELSNIDPIVAKEIQQFFKKEEHQIFNILLLGQVKKELPETMDIEAMTYYLQNALVGIRVLSKTTNNIEKLRLIIDQTLSVIK